MVMGEKYNKDQIFKSKIKWLLASWYPNPPQMQMRTTPRCPFHPSRNVWRHDLLVREKVLSCMLLGRRNGTVLRRETGWYLAKDIKYLPFDTAVLPPGVYPYNILNNMYRLSLLIATLLVTAKTWTATCPREGPVCKLWPVPQPSRCHRKGQEGALPVLLGVIAGMF